MEVVVEGVKIVVPENMEEIKNVALGGTFRGFKLEEMRRAFERIQHPENWKMELKGFILASEFPKYQAAAEWFANSPLKIVEYMGNGWIKIHGDGYYANVGA